MSVKKYKNTLSLLFVFFSTILFLNAQQATISPYTRYGIGQLTGSAFVTQTAMGGIGNAIYVKDRLNYSNPASYSYDTITTFEAGFKAEGTDLKTGSSSLTASGISISYLALGFPIIKTKVGVSIGVLPYSTVGYKVNLIETDPYAGKVQSTFKGDGGLTRFYLGAGYAPFAGLSTKFMASAKYKQYIADHDTTSIQKINKRNSLLSGLSIGCNGSWLFGSIKTQRSVEFLDGTGAYNTRISNSSAHGDFYFNFGMMYTFKMKKDKFFNLGLTGATTTNIKSTYNSLWYNYTSTQGLFETVVDTVQFVFQQTGFTKIPMYYSGGIATGKTGNWLAGIDFTYQDWTKFESSTSNDTLQTSYNVSLGGEWVPNKKGFKFLQKIYYRAGGHYTKTYLNLNTSDIDDYGFSFGFGLPVINKDRIQKAVFNIAFEAGQKGTLKNDLLREQYVRFHIGITINESWFFKRRYE
ncbi:MAG: hypothetical protein ABIT08_04515 [Bacteroidia bacterium]